MCLPLLLLVVAGTFAATAAAQDCGAPAGGLRGDANGDGRVTAADALALEEILAGIVPSIAQADADGDGKVDAADADALPRQIFACSGDVSPPPTATSTQTPPPPAPTSTQTSLPPATATETAPAPTPSSAATETPEVTATEASTATPSIAAATPTDPVEETPPATSTATPPAPTATPPGATGSESVVGNAVLIAQGVDVIGSVITTIIAGAELGGGAVVPSGGGAAACPLGGEVTRSCGAPGPTQTITLSACHLPTATGSVVLDGSAALVASGGFCPTLLFPPYNLTANVQADFRDGQGQTRQTSSANLSGTASPTLGGSCFLTGADLTLSGTLSTSFPGAGGVSLELQATQVGIAVTSFGDSGCVPRVYSFTFDGPATVAQTGAGGGSGAASVDVVFDRFVLAQDQTAMPPQTRLDGGVESVCFGGKVTLQTLSPLEQALGEPCPGAGTVKLTAAGGVLQVLYLAGGAVSIDRDLDGTGEEIYPTCLDPALLVCAALQPTPTPSGTATPSETESPAPTVSPPATATEPSGVGSTVTPEEEPSATPTLGEAPTPTATSAMPPATPTVAGTFTASATPIEPPSATPTAAATAAPAASATATGGLEPATATVTSTPTATESAAPAESPTETPTPTETETTTETPTATATPADTFCDDLPGPALIPDDDPDGVSDDIVIAAAGTISDLDLRLDIGHTYVGDLEVRLLHVETGTQAVLIDRPGFPLLPLGCSRDDISCTLDDEAESPAEDECSVTPPAIAGRLQPAMPLSAFDGEAIAGTWRLTVADQALADEGGLFGWCLEPNRPSQPTPTPTPMAGAVGCCSAHEQPGCASGACEECVCDLDILCCLDSWDAVCLGLALTTCNALCECG